MEEMKTVSQTIDLMDSQRQSTSAALGGLAIPNSDKGWRPSSAELF